MDGLKKTSKPNHSNTGRSERKIPAVQNSTNIDKVSFGKDPSNITVSLNLDAYLAKLKKTLSRSYGKAKAKTHKFYSTTSRKTICAVTLAALLISIGMPVFQELIRLQTYFIGTAEAAVLKPTSQVMADKLTYDSSKQLYEFNQDYLPRNSATNPGAGGPLISAKVYQDPARGIIITDPVNKIDFAMKPLFKLGSGKQQANRIVFPAGRGGHLIYTTEAVGVKEDITLPYYVGDTVSYNYRLELGDRYTARLLPSGAMGIYGPSLPLNGNISTGDAKDAELLQKARQVAAKDKLLFGLPAPVIRETGGHHTAKAKFVLKDNLLTLVAEHLKAASYPLTIDPTITAASGFGGNGLFSFDANIETNVYVDPSNNFIERSPLTGGNLLTWGSASGSTTAVHFLGAAVVYASTLYVIGGTNGTTTTNISNGASSHLIEQSKINSDGTLAGFSDGNYTGLPAGGLSRFQVLTYNGYIYLIDGLNGSTSTAAGGTVSNAVYYTRVTSESYGAFTNGAQLKDWLTTTNKPSTAVYDYGATVYNGSIYVAGGLNSGGAAQTTALNATILPNGDLSAFNSTTALASGRFGLDMQAYNGHLYIIGGNTGTPGSASLTATTLYASIAGDGSIADAAWKSGNSLVSSNGSATQAMENFGTQFSMIYNGYLYVTGGCTAVNSNGSCTAVASYTQLAQLNADGSLGTFFPNDFQSGGTATLARTGTPTLGYNGKIYSIAGCSAMNSASVSCATTSLTSNYASVNTVVGDISNNRAPTSLPVSLMGHATVVLNGYIYLIGGCTTAGSSPYSCDGTRVANYTTYYALINNDGTLGSWRNNTNATNDTSLHFDGENTPLFGSADCSAGGTDHCGLESAAAAVYNGYIYVVGGYDGANYNNGVYYQQPDASNGQTTTWIKSGNTINTAAAELGLIARNGALYVIGGCTATGTPGIGCSTYYRQVQKSTIAAAGAPGAWSSTGGSPTQLQLPANGRAAFGVAVSGDYIYLAGGIDSANNQLSSVTRAKFNSSGNIVAATGSAWTNVTGTMSQPRRRTVAAVVNGYLYVIGGHDASGNGGAGATYGDVQIGKIDMSTGGTGDIASFVQTSTGTVTPRWDASIATGAGFIFVTGGCVTGNPPSNCTSISTVNESFVVYNANGLGVNSWNDPSAYATNRLGAGTAVSNGYMYIAGGCTTFTMTSPTLSCSAVNDTVYYAAINADGTLGAWNNNSSYNLPAQRAFGQLVALNGYLYFMGGQTSSGISGAVSNMYYSQINTSTGAPGSWSATTKTLADTGSGGNANTQFGAVVYSNRIFVAGGYSGSANKSTIYVSPSLANGGDITANWSSTTAFTTARRELSLVSVGAFLYVIGGYDGTNYYADVQVATPNTSTGAISSWTKTEEIPYSEGGLSAIGANGYIFTFGGRSGTASTSCSANVYSASVNGNGTIGHWQQAPNSLPEARFGMAAAFYNGYFFMNGGHNCTAVASSNTVRQSGQLSEAIHATYTRYVDFGTDATFRQLYVLGTNAQISGVDIDKWQIIVKTSTTANNAWGKKSNFTLTGLGTGPAYGTPITFQALDTNGSDQGAAQYWDITFDIDQAQSFNFPDAPTPPQITKYDFYFSPGPGKRLRNGKTFVNNQQTTLDAHP